MSYRVVLYVSAAGHSPVTEYVERLPEKDQAKVLAALDYLADQGPALRRPHAAHVRGKLWELRISLGRKEHRLLYYFREGRIVVVAHAITKKTPALPPREIETAEARMKDFEARIRNGEVEL